MASHRMSVPPLSARIFVSGADPGNPRGDFCHIAHTHLLLYSFRALRHFTYISNDGLGQNSFIYFNIADVWQTVPDS